MDLSECAYYRGTGTCSFGCYDYPRCADLGPPDLATLIRHTETSVTDMRHRLGDGDEVVVRMPEWAFRQWGDSDELRAAAERLNVRFESIE